jgi:organic radical activating enzyme
MELNRSISTRKLIAGLIAQAPLAFKNFRLYFTNLYRHKVLRTNIVAPYALIFYATHKCNLACSYCTQKEPDVFSDELSTSETLRLLRVIRRETDSVVFTGGEPTLRADIEELVAAARQRLRFRSVMLITNGTLLDRRSSLFDNLTGLVISLDALTMDPTNSSLETRSLAESAGEYRARQIAHASSANDHHQHGDRRMEYLRNRAHSGLDRGARLRLRDAIRP